MKIQPKFFCSFFLKDWRSLNDGEVYVEDLISIAVPPFRKEMVPAMVPTIQEKYIDEGFEIVFTPGFIDKKNKIFFDGIRTNKLTDTVRQYQKLLIV